MPVDKEKLSELKERYDKAIKLMEEESKSDPESDPFRSHYAARDILLEIRAALEKLLSTEDTDDTKLIYKSLLGFIYKNLGQLYIFVEEVTTGRKYLQDCILLLEDLNTNPEAIIPLVGSLNQLGILQANLSETKDAKESLLRAEKIYNDFNAEPSAEPLTTINDLFATKEEIESGAGRLLLEKTHTLTLYYLAQVVCTLGEADDSRRYCHNTLKRQLEFNDYEHIDWALNAATLSQCFLNPEGLSHARHHLAAASYMMERFQGQMLKPEMSEEQKGAQLEEFQHRNADVSRCWVKYALYILTHSKERLMEDKDDEKVDKQGKKIKSLTLKEQDKMTFSLDLSIYETKITDQPVLMFEDAKEVYLFALGHINTAKEYYKADTLASEYAKVIMDLSSMIKYLAFFEENEDDQCKLYKKQADHLENLVGLLNPTYYLVICREVWYELGITYMTMLDIKLDKLKNNDRPSPHALNKVNTLSDKGIRSFGKFYESFPKIDDTTSDEEMQLILYAYFHLGRLYYKKITPDKRMQFENLENSLKFYNLFLTGCDKRETLTKGMLGEIGCCREMVRLLPLKLAQINVSIGS